MVLSKLMGADKDSSVYGRYKKGREASKKLGDLTVEAEDQLMNQGLTEFSDKEITEQLSSLLKAKNLPPLKVLESSTPGIANILKSITGGEGLKTGMENLQSAMMLPMLLQQLLGE